LKVQQVDVLPLVDNIKRYDSVINDYKRGWCTYSGCQTLIAA